jgi:MYXO-CTERM domain-containing protein
MSHVRSTMYLMAAAMLLVGSCGDADPIDRFIADTEPLALHEPGPVREAARYSDPLALIFVATMPAEMALSAFRDEEDLPSCPRLINASDPEAGIVDWRIEGDCDWSEGSIVARGDANRTTIEYRGFRQWSASEDECEGLEDGTAVTGVVTVPFPIYPWTYGEFDHLPPEPDDLGKGHYELHLLFELSGVESEPCRTTRTSIAYDATIERRLERANNAYSWNDTSDIQGRAAVRQEVQPPPEEPWLPSSLPSATWRLSATDYGIVRDRDACEGDYVTGTLRLEAGGGVAILHPDETMSCFDGSEDGAGAYAACTLWSLNGEEQTEEMCGFVSLMDGVGCSAGPDAPPPWAAIALLLGGLLWQRRRSRRAAR